ncbi:hypothetical protein C5Y96_10835 [Blastopirellula marina]|uniref:Uncharacterized protein n=1 Tax=Blastopirellula marina TaxID=124 RepID=A0A2S8FMC2_9BACT|nr:MULTISPECIES: hypothetical protein [Pirellulaceae]PQO33339.1 hypothetical protein C5Y96_10835 [Blastopirellula marina]RCS52428.1 hypothetical protein DTL36_10845 [Bremerella cremea]
MGTAIFREGTLVMLFAGDLPEPSPVVAGDELIEADTADEALAVYDTTHGTNLAAVKAKRQEVVDGYADAIAAGYDTGLGFSLKLSEEDQRVLFDYQQRLLRQIAKDPPEISSTDIKPLKGTDDAWHLITVEQIINAIDGGAGHVENLNGAYAGYEAMLAQGVTQFVVDFAQP